VYAIDDLAFTESAIFVLQANSRTLLKLDRSTGIMLKTHIGEGQGPGEWVRPWHVEVFEGMVYVFDQAEGDYSVFTTDLKHIKDIKVNVFIMSPVLNSRGLFSATHNKTTQAIMVHYPGPDRDPVEFGRSAPVHQGNQWGYLTQKDDRLYHFSGVYFRISVFDLEAKLIQVIEPPFGNKDFFEGCDLTAPNFTRTCDEWASPRAILSDGSEHLYVYLRPRKSQRFFLYRYNLNTKEWAAAPTGYPYSDGKQLYESFRMEDERMALKPVDVIFRTYGER
jgi:hypothetical protein